MKFKIDENLLMEFGRLLEAAGHQADTVGEERLSGASDDIVLERSRTLAFLASPWRPLHETSDHLIDEKIQRGFDQFERGEYFTAEEARAVMAQRKAAWLATSPGSLFIYSRFI